MTTGWTIEELDEANPGREGAPTSPFRELLESVLKIKDGRFGEA